MKRIAVVGGGFAGVTVARAMDSFAEVRLVEPRDRFVHNVAAIRAPANASWLDRVAIPYDRLLTQGAVIHDKAVEIGEGMVRLSDGTILEADVVVSATGSTYALPFKPAAGGSVAEYLEASRGGSPGPASGRGGNHRGSGSGRHRTRRRDRRRPSGEKVHLVSALSALLPGHPRKLGESMARQLKAMGVELVLGKPVQGLEGLAGPQFDASTREMRQTVTGARPTPPPIPNLKLSSNGRAVVHHYLRAEGLPNVFIVSDAAETGDPMTAHDAYRQAGWLIKTLKVMLAGRDVISLRPYTPGNKPALFLPSRPKAGAGVLPIPRNGWMVGFRLTATIKGRDLFVSDSRKRLGYQPRGKSK
jgi:apoptosis-inducing factor 2